MKQMNDIEHGGHIVRLFRSQTFLTKITSRTTSPMITYSPLDFKQSEDNKTFHTILHLVGKHLSEPYSLYVFRFFLNNWPELCLIARDSEIEPSQEQYDKSIIGVIISKCEPHRDVRNRGYIGMVAVEPAYRGRGIAKRLISDTIDTMIDNFEADEIILETESANEQALKLYENFGFIRVKRLFRYYLNQNDAYRLILPVTEKALLRSTFLERVVDIDRAEY